MQQLLQNYSITEILLFIVILAVAIKGVISFIDWARQRIHKAVKEKEKPDRNAKHNDKQDQQLQYIKNELDILKKYIELLTQSDKDAIKSFITGQHHYFCYKLGYIDDYSLDSIEKRYNHYKEQGGNSFVEDLMFELRQLPKHALSREDYQKQDYQYKGNS